MSFATEFSVDVFVEAFLHSPVLVVDPLFSRCFVCMYNTLFNNLLTTIFNYIYTETIFLGKKSTVEPMITRTGNEMTLSGD